MTLSSAIRGLRASFKIAKFGGAEEGLHQAQPGRRPGVLRANQLLGNRRTAPIEFVRIRWLWAGGLRLLGRGDADLFTIGRLILGEERPRPFDLLLAGCTGEGEPIRI